MRGFIFLILATFIFFLSACETVKRDKMQGTTFLFYPLKNIYYDNDNKEYYYYDSVQAVWQTTPKLAPEISSRLGKYVLLDSVPVPVYKDNALHRLIHGSILYSSPAEIRRQYKEDSLASLPKKDTVAVVDGDSTQSKKKSRLGRWLEKVFGKKGER